MDTLGDRKAHPPERSFSSFFVSIEIIHGRVEGNLIIDALMHLRDFLFHLNFWKVSSRSFLHFTPERKVHSLK